MRKKCEEFGKNAKKCAKRTFIRKATSVGFSILRLNEPVDSTDRIRKLTESYFHCCSHTEAEATCFEVWLKLQRNDEQEICWFLNEDGLKKATDAYAPMALWPCEILRCLLFLFACFSLRCFFLCCLLFSFLFCHFKTSIQSKKILNKRGHIH